jgi:hypothetical protein
LSFGDEDEDYEDLEDGECWNYIWTSTFTWSVNFKTRFALPMTSCVKEPSLGISTMTVPYLEFRYHLHLYRCLYPHICWPWT